MADVKNKVISIGGREWQAGPLSLWALEQCWDDLQRLRNTGNLPQTSRTLAGIAAAAIAGTMPPNVDTPSVDAIMRAGGKAFFQELDKFVKSVLEVSDVFEKPDQGGTPKGEGETAASAASSMAASSQLSQNLSPEASVVEIGTELPEPSLSPVSVS